MSEEAVNFVAFDAERDACLMVLVEEGPWGAQVDDNLIRLQGRLYSCLDAALDGQLAENFPRSKGMAVVVRVDCYDLPQTAVEDFIHRFSEGVATLPDYSTRASPFVREFLFEVNHDTLMGS
jgi:hypothetical protein